MTTKQALSQFDNLIILIQSYLGFYLFIYFISPFVESLILYFAYWCPVFEFACVRHSYIHFVVLGCEFSLHHNVYLHLGHGIV